MNRVVVLAVALALAPMAWGQLYKYTDKDGKVHYTDQPPANVDGKEIKAPPPGPTAPAQATPEKAAAPAKGRPQAQAPQKAEAALTAEQKAERCQAARENYANFLDGPVTMRNTKTGERVELDEKGIEAEKAKAKTAMDTACKQDR
jgi:hypothetical protein